MPLVFYVYSVFYVFRNIVLFKLFILIVVLASSFAFYSFLRRLTGSLLIPGTCLLLLPLVIQFRTVWDPILGFCAEYPLVALLLFCSLILFLKYLDDHDRRASVAAAVLFLCCGMIVEISYLLCVLYFAVAYFRLRRSLTALLASVPFTAVTALLVTISFILKKMAVNASEIYRPNFNPARVLKAYAVQSFERFRSRITGSTLTVCLPPKSPAGLFPSSRDCLFLLLWR